MASRRLEAVPSPKDILSNVEGVLTGDQLMERTVPVRQALRDLLPGGGLPQGTTVGLTGDASVSFALALVAEAIALNRWLGVIGGRRLGLAALTSAGVPLERVVIFDPEASSRSRELATYRDVVAMTLSGFDLLIVCDERGTVIGDQRIAARVRERGAVLVGVDTTVGPTLGRHRWDQRPDIVVDITTISWTGLQDGAGSIEGRTVEVSVAGRRIGRPIVRRLWLPDSSGQLRAIPVEPERYAGSDIDALLDAEDRLHAQHGDTDTHTHIGAFPGVRAV